MARARVSEAPDADAELIARVGEGDVAAYRELVERHGRRLLHYAARLMGDLTEAEDVVQETFLRLWQRADDYSPRARVTTWLHRITHNLAVDRLRQRGRWRTLDDGDDAPVSARQESRLTLEQQTQTLDEALRALPERQRAALTLVHLHELSGKEAAQVLDVSEEALESLLARGRRTLKARLEERERAGAPLERELAR